MQWRRALQLLETMAEMDILYGVFMQETGVSGVAAVDFRDFGKIDLFNPN